MRDAPSDTSVASSEVRVAGKMGSAKCVEILLRACKDEGVEPPRTAALIGAAAHGALDAARVLCKGLGGTSTVITPAIVRVDLRVKRNPTWVHEWGDHQRQHPRIGAEGLVKAWTDLDGDKRGSYPQIRRPELNEPGLCVVRWADPVNEQICRIGHEDEFWLVAADENQAKVPPAVAHLPLEVPTQIAELLQQRNEDGEEDAVYSEGEPGEEYLFGSLAAPAREPALTLRRLCVNSSRSSCVANPLFAGRSCGRSFIYRESATRASSPTKTIRCFLPLPVICLNLLP